MRPPALTSIIVLISFLSACASPPRQPVIQGGDPTHLGVAQAAEDSGDYALAETIYAKAAAAAPTDTALQLRYADALVKHGKISAAHDVLATHLNTASDPQRLHGTLGLILVLQGEPAQAIPEFDAASHGNDPRWGVDKAVALDMLGRHGEAQALYRAALSAQSDDATVLNDLSLSLLLSGQRTEAFKIAAPLAGRIDLSPRIIAGLGVVLAANGDMASAHRVIGTTAEDTHLQQIATAIKQIGN
jgi:Flp pilus assembly protein TadD